MQLDLNLLTALDALLEEESVTGAADRLHLSAPAMSRTLGRIRAVTGDPILVRNGRHMHPTPRALALREEVRSLVLRSREVLAPERELDVATLQRTFAIRGHDALTAVLAPALLRRVAQDAPGVSLRFLGEAAADTSDLRRGVVDLEVGSAVAATPDVEQEHLSDDELVGVARGDHPLLRGAIDLDAYAAAPHIVVSRRGRLRDRTDEALEASGRSRTVVASVASTAAAVEMVLATDAVVVLPASVARRLHPGLGLASFTPPVGLPPVAVVLAWPRRFSGDSGHAWMRDQVRRILAPEPRPVTPR